MTETGLTPVEMEETSSASYFSFNNCSARKFPLFRFLPPELREQIWNDTIESRTLLLHPHCSFFSWCWCHLPAHQSGEIASYYFSVWQISKIPAVKSADTGDEWKVGDCLVQEPLSTPALLHVCRESRMIGLKRYRLSFAGHTSERACDEDKNCVRTALRHKVEVARWEKKRDDRKLGLMRPWVNFKEDLIIVDGEFRLQTDQPTPATTTRINSCLGSAVSGAVRSRRGDSNSKSRYPRAVMFHASKRRNFNFDMLLRLPAFKELRSLTFCGFEQQTHQNACAHTSDNTAGVLIFDIEEVKRSLVREIEDWLAAPGSVDGEEEFPITAERLLPTIHFVNDL